jgi:hypothetical protein
LFPSSLSSILPFQGIEAGENGLGVPALLLGNEMINKKVSEQAVMCYLSQYRNLTDDCHVKVVDPASLCSAYGPGLIEAIANEKALFKVDAPGLMGGGSSTGGHATKYDAKNDKLSILVKGPSDKAAVSIEKSTDAHGDAHYAVEYTPSSPGAYEVHITLTGSHIPGSVFHVTVVGGATALVPFFRRSFVFSALCARKSHDPYATLHAPARGGFAGRRGQNPRLLLDDDGQRQVSRRQDGADESARSKKGAFAARLRAVDSW